MTTRLMAKLQKMKYRYWPELAIEENFYSLLFHMETALDAEPIKTGDISTMDVRDGELVKRIISTYQRASETDLGDSMWKLFFSAYHQPIHQKLITGDVASVTKLLRNPEESDLFYGFDILTKAYRDAFKRKRVQKAYAKLCLDGMVRFAECLGAANLDNPERWSTSMENQWDIETVLRELSNMGVSFSISNPFPNENGLASSGGLISYRVPQALYQARRIKQLVQGIQNPRVLEIGAGLGRTAHYAYELGIKDYTIVDIPITATSQAYYLGRVLGETNILLDGESAKCETQKIKIISPGTFLNSDNKYDLIINVDSLTEMDLQVAQTYWAKIKSCTKKFWSVNHEANPFRVKDLILNDLKSLDIQRELYWMRRGYVEELVQIRDYADTNNNEI